MFIAIKGNRKIGLHSDVQADAYRKSGWDISPAGVDETTAEDAKGLNEEGETMPFDDLRAEAKALGVSFHPNIGYDTLLERVLEARSAKVENGPAD